jgi:MFS family permease
VSPGAEPAETVGSRSWLTRNVRVLSGVSLLQDAASEMLYPVLPIFLTVTLGAPASVVGLTEGLAEGISSVVKLFAGRYADRRGRRSLIAAGYGLAAVGKLFIALAFVWPVVLLGRGVDRVGKGIRGAPRDALLMVDADPAARGRIFGFHRAADTLGAVIGPAVGLAIYEALGHRIRPLLIIAVVPAVASVGLVRWVADPGAPAKARTRSRIATLGSVPPALRSLILVLGLFSLVNFPDALLLLRAHDLGLSTAAVIGVYIVYNFVYAAASYPAGAWSDKAPRHLVFALGLGFFAVGYLGLGLIHDSRWVWLILPLYGGFAACTDGVGKAWVAELAPGGGQGSAQGLFQAVTGAGVLVAGIVAGLAWRGDGRLPLLTAGTVGAALAVLLAVIGGRWRAAVAP